MISITRHIQYLILKHDCVVVPGFGAFVSRFSGASISPDGSRIQPPSREISFNSLLTHDDGLLIGSVTRREGVSYECARSRVEQEVELIQRRIRHEGIISLPRIGSFSMTDHGALEFTPDSENCMSQLPYLGFEPLSVTPLNVVSAQKDAPVILEVDTSPAPVAQMRSRRFNLLRYAASAALLIGACLTFLTPLKAPEGISLASLRPSMERVALQSATAVESPIASPARYAGRVIVLTQPDPAEATAPVPSKKESIADEANHTDSLPRYYVVVASTTSAKEARRYVKKHSTAKRPLQILIADGRYRVYAASGNDFNAMSAYRKADPAFAAANPNAWVYTLK